MVASHCPMVYSATVSMCTGVTVTGTPWRVAAATFTWSKPTPQRATTRSSFAAA